MTLIDTTALHMAAHRALVAGQYPQALALLIVLANRTDNRDPLESLGSYQAHNDKRIRGEGAVQIQDLIDRVNGRVKRSSYRPPMAG